MTFINNLPINFNIPKISFRSNSTVYTKPIHGEPLGDGFTSNPLYEGFGSESEIISDAKSNPRIKELLKEYKISIKPNMQELDQLKQGHLKQTRVIAAQIYSSLPPELKSEVNLPDLQQAAMFHDYGKVLIPASILNKEGALNDAEHEIMNLHSELGYELLKNKNFSENALGMIKNHHSPENDIGAQILNVADKYSALTEERCYKDSMSKEEALAIIEKDVQNGLILPEIYNALRKTV